LNWLQKIVEMSKTEAAEGIHGVQFRVFFDLEVIDGEQTLDQLRASLKQKILVKDYGGEYRGAQAKFWFDILEDENYSGMGNVIAYIAEVFMKIEKRTELSLPDLQEFIRSEKCRVLYNVIEQGETINDRIGFYCIPKDRLCHFATALLEKHAQSDSIF